MKKVFPLMLLLATMLSFTACSDDDKPSTDDIVGTWQISEASFDGKDYISWPFESTSATFNSDGTYYGRGYLGSGSGTWEQKGKTIITKVDGEEYIRYEVQSLSSATCTLKMIVEDETIWIKCIKK